VEKTGSSNNNESVDAKWTEEFIKQAVVQFEALLSQGKHTNKLGVIVTKFVSCSSSSFSSSSLSSCILIIAVFGFFKSEC
jgi:hypothetical protein